MLLLNLIFFVLTSIILMTSSTFIVISLTKIAHFLKISRFTASFIIMAFATAIPELFIGISSAVSNNPSLSLGNVIGSSMLHFSLLAGVFILMAKGIRIKSKKIGKEIYFVLFSIILLITLALINRSLSRIDGIILISFFALSSYRLIKKSRKYSARLNQKNMQRARITLYFFIFFISMVILFISSKYIVEFASLIALNLKLPKLLVGIFLLSLSTNLPELAFGIKAIEMGYKEMALGDLTGGVITNLGLVAGVVAIISPFSIDLAPFLISSILLLVSAIAFVVFLKSGHELTIKEGLILLLIYILFITIQFLAK